MAGVETNSSLIWRRRLSLSSWIDKPSKRYHALAIVLIRNPTVYSQDEIPKVIFFDTEKS